jgi:hypothetical protein
MAGEIYDFLDSNHPLYVEIAKKTKSTRRRVQKTTLALTGLALTLLLAKKMPENWLGIGGGKVNQFGAVRRK